RRRRLRCAHHRRACGPLPAAGTAHRAWRGHDVQRGRRLVTTPAAPQAAAHADLEARARARLMNTYTRQPLAIASGHGAWVADAEGRELIDLVAGIAVNVLGHCHPAVQSALSAQAAALIHTSNLYYTSPQLELAELLVD